MSSEITAEYALARMAEVAEKSGGDPETAHCEADSILCELLRALGHGELVDKFDEVRKWYA